jgi:broad specificity phosphatase PhoE
MTIRLKLVCHAATSAVRSYAFPADEPLHPQAQRKLAAMSHGPAPAARVAHRLAHRVGDAATRDTTTVPAARHDKARSKLRATNIGHADRSWTSPSLCARQTVELLKLDATVEPMLRDCDYGSWTGRTFEDVQAQEPDALAAWLRDPGAAPHGGESLLSLLARVAGWLDAQGETSGKTVAVTHASVIRAAVVHAIEATPRSFWRIDIAPLSVTTLSGHHGRWTLASIAPLQGDGDGR